jgi:hypothetical protein
VSLAKLQRRLRELGLYDGKITRDGNRATQTAIKLYREREIHDDEIERLLAKRSSQ